jgi:hypothetical protein
MQIQACRNGSLLQMAVRFITVVCTRSATVWRELWLQRRALGAQTRGSVKGVKLSSHRLKASRLTVGVQIGVAIHPTELTCFFLPPQNPALAERVWGQRGSGCGGERQFPQPLSFWPLQAWNRYESVVQNSQCVERDSSVLRMPSQLNTGDARSKLCRICARNLSPLFLQQGSQKAGVRPRRCQGWSSSAGLE